MQQISPRFFVWCHTPWPACWGRPQRPGNAYQRAGHSTLFSWSITAQLDGRMEGWKEKLLSLRAAPLVQLPIDHILRGSGSVLKCRIQKLTLSPLELHSWFIMNLSSIHDLLRLIRTGLRAEGKCKGTVSPWREPIPHNSCVILRKSDSKSP